MNLASAGVSEDWIDVLLPSSDVDLNALAALKLNDAGSSVSLGPLDQALVAVCDRLLAIKSDCPTLVIQLPLWEGKNWASHWALHCRR